MTSKEIAYTVLEQTKTILDEMFIPFMLDGGTLLGIYRDEDFCQDDWMDIDLTTHARYNRNIPELIKIFEDNGYTVHNHWHFNDLAHELSVIKEGIKVDLFFKEEKGDITWHCLYGKSKPIFKKNLTQHFTNLVPILFRGKMYQIPKDTPDYLTELYGDWEKPIHRKEWSCYDNSNCFCSGKELGFDM